MIYTRITVRGMDIFKRLKNLGRHTIGLLTGALEEAADAVRPDILNVVRREPPIPGYIVQLGPRGGVKGFQRKPTMRWASPAQKNYVMMILRKSGNLPYRRTHALSQAWQVKVAFRRGTTALIVENPSSIARYVYGPQQQPFHADLGWPNLFKTEGDTSFIMPFVPQINTTVRAALIEGLQEYVTP